MRRAVIAVLVFAVAGCITYLFQPKAPEVRLATFNIRVFGPTKASKPQLLSQLAQIIRKYDLVAVQEIKDKRETVPKFFLQTINQDGSTYDLLLSPRTGRHESDRTSQEQYAFYFNTKTIRSMGNALLYDDAEDRFQREPFLARFAAGRFTFVAITVHTKPAAALSEIEALHEVFRWGKERFPGEDDFILLGDLNAGCAYVRGADLDSLPIRAHYTWIVPDDADTTVSDRSCAYDRILTTGARHNEWGVDSAFSDPAISDHWPVWASFTAAE